MDAEYIDRNHIIERYLLGSLPTEEVDQFEDMLLSDTNLLMQVEAAERALEQIRARTRSSADEAGSSYLNWRMAASFLLGALGVGSVMQYQFVSGDSQLSVNPEIYFVETFRGQTDTGTSASEESLESGASVVLILSADRHGKYDLTLETDEGVHVRESLAHIPDGLDQLTWLLAMPEAGRYFVVARTANTEEVILRHPLTVR